MDRKFSNLIIQEFCHSQDILEEGVLHKGFVCGGGRLWFDFKYCVGTRGFTQYDTIHDASYFGIWVNLKELSVVSFVEGDIYVKLLNSVEEMKNELDDMNSRYEEIAAFTVIDVENQRITKVFNDRPRIYSDYEKFFWGEDETDAEIELYKKFNEEDKK